mmetsp:Transcript_20998/g.53378  ORF Transcript_20998/g.53378 Transcript_20998/m.53378 type:complete len:432 (-) Transcript_20998:593-1888(-)|eukprot:CAMPEP_0202883776 /NCGR_PEP_ID=MMETSP1391-20130828/39922_1 /ASSEMBLY_ACC=CAM_ASM_000867 /TAXON_ID=1034604 /ORGANISM="Chlamydomonas leiostraca, Strain SAG 11-49" /LENGTH=431 /DNA_ID=CAMNT_0049566851 /DNA_START=477 /DNA_END=1772 /DNA_ORIENTATION=-
MEKPLIAGLLYIICLGKVSSETICHNRSREIDWQKHPYTSSHVVQVHHDNNFHVGEVITVLCSHGFKVAPGWNMSIPSSCAAAVNDEVGIQVCVQHQPIPTCHSKAPVRIFISDYESEFDTTRLNPLALVNFDYVLFKHDTLLRTAHAMTFAKSRPTPTFDLLSSINHLVGIIHKLRSLLPFRNYRLATEDILDDVPLTSNPLSRKVAVIVEGRIHASLRFVVRTTLWHLGPTWGLHILHTHINQHLVKHIASEIPSAVTTLLPYATIDICRYNRIFGSHTFWDSLNADKVLIFQTDSILLKAGVNDYLAFDYVGAPWDLGKKYVSDLPNNVGNGGLSLRSVNVSRQVAARHGPNECYSEDLWFMERFKVMKDVQIAPRHLAYKFSLELPCPDLQIEEHIGMHAAWLYNSPGVIISQLNSSTLHKLNCATW